MVCGTRPIERTVHGSLELPIHTCDPRRRVDVGPAPTEGDVAQEFLRTASRTALRLTPCGHTAGDLVGETALRLWSRHREVLERRQFKSYVESCVRNLRRDHLRRWHRTPLFTDLDSDGVPFQPTMPAAGSDDAAALAATSEFRDGLSADDRAVLEHLEDGRSTRDIAELVGQTRHAVRASVERIRDRARDHFPDLA